MLPIYHAKVKRKIRYIHENFLQQNFVIDFHDMRLYNSAYDEKLEMADLGTGRESFGYESFMCTGKRDGAMDMEEVRVIKKVQEELFERQDVKYRDFQAKLMPTIEKERVIGVRTPALRSFAKAYGKTEDAAVFLQVLPHEYYEENNLHGLLLDQINDYEQCVRELDHFLPYIDNWATCDMIAVRVVKKHLNEFIGEIKRWLASEHTYTIRFGISMLMRYYLEEQFQPEYAEMVAQVRSEEYYVNMMRAWYFATALAKQYETILPFVEEKRLDVWTHNKTIQKSIESYRITAEQKAYLRTLKQRNEKIFQV